MVYLTGDNWPFFCNMLMHQIALYQMPQTYLPNNSILLNKFHSFQPYFFHASNNFLNICCMPITNLQVGFPREERAHTGQSDIVCFSFSLHSDTFPPNNHHCLQSHLQQKDRLTSITTIIQSPPKKTDMILDDTVAAKIRLPQSFKQRFFEHQSSSIHSPVPLIS